ncbi:MAG: molybdopterin-guanine dinucleotide biosynthesis protein B [Deltaproteobacteria bacterium]|nr:molybdopterin-guanine dinucleotide biosynthesis protein B [Deltaproteobacteria bacterium]
MKAVGVIGYKKSGKTTVVMRLSQELSQMGYSVAILKHVSGDIDFPHTDTSKFRTHAAFVSAISSKESEIILKGRKRIEDILTYVDCDIVLIEGFKKEKTFPKIVCIRNKGEESELFDGLQLFTASFSEDISEFSIENDDHVKKMAAIVSEKSFKLPNLNCGHCGYESCFDLAKEIVKGKKSIANCVSLNPPISIKVDGAEFPLNPFMSNLFKNSFSAMLSSLKGFKKGRIEIDIP